MSAQIINVAVPNSATALCVVPPNATASFSIATGAGGYVALGLSSTVTTTTGFAVSPGIPHSFYLPPPSKSYMIWGIASVAGPISIGIIITTAE